MAEIFDVSWLAQRLNQKDILVVDSRPPVKYLQGHVPGAVNLPSSKIFHPTSLELLPVDQLASVFAEKGVDENRTVVFYDGYDGQNAAILAWTLEFLGHRRVGLLSRFIEGWEDEAGELLYRPVKPEPRVFRAKPNQAIRATIDKVQNRGDYKLVDLRSSEEFLGKLSTEPRRGRLPEAISLPWTSLLGQNNGLFRPRNDLEKTVAERGLRPSDHIITYCSFGPRAALGYVALSQLGFEDIRVYDGSFHQWAQHQELPVETDTLIGASSRIASCVDPFQVLSPSPST